MWTRSGGSRQGRRTSCPSVCLSPSPTKHSIPRHPHVRKTFSDTCHLCLFHAALPTPSKAEHKNAHSGTRKKLLVWLTAGSLPYAPPVPTWREERLPRGTGGPDQTRQTNGSLLSGGSTRKGAPGRTVPAHAAVTLPQPTAQTARAPCTPLAKRGPRLHPLQAVVRTQPRCVVSEGQGAPRRGSPPAWSEPLGKVGGGGVAAAMRSPLSQTGEESGPSPPVELS